MKQLKVIFIVIFLFYVPGEVSPAFSLRLIHK